MKQNRSTDIVEPVVMPTGRLATSVLLLAHVEEYLGSDIRSCAALRGTCFAACQAHHALSASRRTVSFGTVAHDVEDVLRANEDDPNGAVAFSRAAVLGTVCATLRSRHAHELAGVSSPTAALMGPSFQSTANGAVVLQEDHRGTENGAVTYTLGMGPLPSVKRLTIEHAPLLRTIGEHAFTFMVRLTDLTIGPGLHVEEVRGPLLFRVPMLQGACLGGLCTARRIRSGLVFDCPALERVDLGTVRWTAERIDSGAVVGKAPRLRYVDLSPLRGVKLIESRLISDCAVLEDLTLSADLGALSDSDDGLWVASEVGLAGIVWNAPELRRLDLSPLRAVQKLCGPLASCCDSLVDLSLGTQPWQAQAMGVVCERCDRMEVLDLSALRGVKAFNTSLLRDCHQLVDLQLGEEPWAAQRMEGTPFANLKRLPSLDLSALRGVRSFNGPLVRRCDSLTELSLGADPWETQSMDIVCERCERLPKIDLSALCSVKFFHSNLVVECRSVGDLRLGERAWEARRIEHPPIEKLETLSFVDLSPLRNVSGFGGGLVVDCRAIERIDLGNHEWQATAIGGAVLHGLHRLTSADLSMLRGVRDFGGPLVSRCGELTKLTLGRVGPDGAVPDEHLWRAHTIHGAVVRKLLALRTVDMRPLARCRNFMRGLAFDCERLEVLTLGVVPWTADGIHGEIVRGSNALSALDLSALRGVRHVCSTLASNCSNLRQVSIGSHPWVDKRLLNRSDDKTLLLRCPSVPASDQARLRRQFEEWAEAS